MSKVKEPAISNCLELSELSNAQDFKFHRSKNSSLEIGFRNEKLFVKPQKGILLDHEKESSQVPSPFRVSWCVNIKCHHDYPCVSSCDT